MTNNNEIAGLIAGVLECDVNEVENVCLMKKGMTNRSYRFGLTGEKYIIRLPGEGTENLINRKQEADVYRAIAGKGLCEDPVYINPDNGIKISRYLDDVRVCDPYDISDITKCMKILKQFHSMDLFVGHEFDIFETISFYERLWGGKLSIYEDYNDTKEKVFSLAEYIDSMKIKKCLTHIDAVSDNFLFYRTEDQKEEIQLVDWEYAGMQDPHVDIAMFCIYSMYGKVQCDRLIDIYFDDKCEDNIRTKIYCYISACGLLWSNWCEYKHKLGVDFGKYSTAQYNYAKEFYFFANERIRKL